MRRSWQRANEWVEEISRVDALSNHCRSRVSFVYDHHHFDIQCPPQCHHQGGLCPFMSFERVIPSEFITLLLPLGPQSPPFPSKRPHTICCPQWVHQRERYIKLKSSRRELHYHQLHLDLLYQHLEHVRLSFAIRIR